MALTDAQYFNLAWLNDRRKHTMIGLLALIAMLALGFAPSILAALLIWKAIR